MGSPSSSSQISNFAQQPAGRSPPYTAPGYNPSNSPPFSQVWRPPSPMFEPPLISYQASSPDLALFASVCSYTPSQPPSPKLPFNHLVSPPPQISSIETFNSISPYQAQKLRVHETPSLAHMYDHATYRRSSPSPVIQTPLQILRSNSPQPSPGMSRTSQPYVKGISHRLHHQI